METTEKGRRDEYNSKSPSKGSKTVNQRKEACLGNRLVIAWWKNPFFVVANGQNHRWNI